MRDRPSWDETWLAVARDVARRSLCDRDRVGAVIVDYRNRIVATGYNGAPRGFQHGGQSCSTWCARAQSVDAVQPLLRQRQQLAADYSDCPSLHAEINAISVCDQSVREGGTIYITSHACFQCAKEIANAGLARVVVAPTSEAQHRPWQTGYILLNNCGVEVEIKDVL